MVSIAASDSTSWLHCHGRVWLDKNPPAGAATVTPSEFDQLIITMGLRHEWNIKRELARQYQLVEAVSEEHTRALMEAGAQIIYQGQLSEGDIIGKPDFLIRHESGQYQAADAKLARSEEKKKSKSSLVFTASCWATTSTR